MSRRGTPDGLPPALKRLGQHFLTDERVLDRIVQTLELQGGETVIEIGPGRAALTDRLAAVAGSLHTIEIDAQLIPWLRARFAASPQVHIVHADVLETPLGSLVDGPYVLAGNVPYYITTPIIFHALRSPRAQRAVYLVQREVAERACAAAGDEAYGALTVNLQVLAHVALISLVKPGAFAPPPKVDSAILRVVPLVEPLVTPDEEGPFAAFVRAMFGMRRKQLRRALRSVAGVDAAAADEALASVGLDGDRRCETITPAEFVALFRATAAR
jgi:16S rRNA (adenine1518-N6/adenine1519-N6)-dimethyltransferase